MQQLTNINQITTEIIILKNQTAQNIIEIGRRLNSVKEILPHGEFQDWLTVEVDFSYRQAARLMQVAKEFSNVPTLAGLSVSKVYALLDVPTEERDQFIQQPQIIPSTGEQKTVNEMTTRELQEAIKARKEAEKAAKDAELKASQAHAQAESERRQREQAEKKLAEMKNKQPQVIEKTVEKQVEVIPIELKDELSRLKTENSKLQNKNLQLKARLSTSEMDPAERLKKARLSQKVLDEELLWLDGRIKTFLKEVAPYIYVADSFMNMKEYQIKEYAEVLEKLEDWLNTMKRAMPFGGQVIDINGGAVNE